MLLRPILPWAITLLLTGAALADALTKIRETRKELSDSAERLTSARKELTSIRQQQAAKSKRKDEVALESCVRNWNQKSPC